MEGGFRGASKDFRLKDGILCTTIINKGYISICCFSKSDRTNRNTMHILLAVTLKALESFFYENDSKEIFRIYCQIN